MTVEGLWKIGFVSNNSTAGAGILVLETERIFGGDTSFYYLGHYTVKDGHLIGTATVKRYSPYLPSVFPEIEDFQLEIDGTFNTDSIKGIAKMAGVSNNELVFVMNKLADLP